MQYNTLLPCITTFSMPPWSAISNALLLNNFKERREHNTQCHMVPHKFLMRAESILLYNEADNKMVNPRQFRTSCEPQKDSYATDHRICIIWKLQDIIPPNFSRSSHSHHLKIKAHQITDFSMNSASTASLLLTRLTGKATITALHF